MDDRKLRLPSLADDEDDFLVEKDDSDTWEWLLDLARSEAGEKIEVVANVEV